ncbi:type IV pilus inner membrane component PilO [Wohlfahrtiimonas populi]|uniref:type 4a pilus biogenesis protein PilO n=1 Tax=Wohlfahrtiimonas populi TaxID=1940240 RepID=UPI00098D0272|nr:type 4a pilus biogenesis protein PilO [Wohlfahrtiimonas populi]
MNINMDFNELFTIEYLAKQPVWLKSVVFLVSALATFLLVFFGAFKYFDFSAQYQAQKDSEDQKLNELAAKLEFKALADRYLVEIEQVNKLLEEVRKKLPRDLNAANFIEQLNMNALQAGIDVKKSMPLSPVSKGFYTEIPVRIEGCATYDQIGQFVANLSEIERIITLDNFGINSYVPMDQLPQSLESLKSVNNVTIPTFDCGASGRQAFSAMIATYRYNS